MSIRLNYLNGSTSETLRWASPFVLVAIATIVRLAADPFLGSAARFAFFFPAVAIAAHMWGFWPGMLTTALSLFSGSFFFIQPRFSPSVFYTEDVASLVVFAVVGLVLCLIGRSTGGWHRRLEEATNRFRVIFNRAGVGIAEVDSQGRFIAANDRLCEILGYPREALLGKNVHDLTDPRDRPRSDKLNAQLRNGEIERFELEKRYLRKDGSPVWIHLTASTVKNEGGKVERAIGTIQDIDERKRAEEALLKSEAETKARLEELTAIMDAVPALTFIARDRDCRHMDSSRITREILRVPEGGDVSKSAPEGKRPNSFRVLREGRELKPEELPVQVAAASGRPVRNFELTLEFQDGSSRDISGDAVPLLDSQGNSRGAVGAFSDITERKRSEKLLQLRNAGLALLSDAAADLLGAKDPQQIVEELFVKAGKFVGADIFLNYMLKNEGPELFLESCGGIDEAARQTFMKIEIGQRLCGGTAEMRKPLHLTEVQKSHDSRASHFQQLGVRAYASFPLIAGERLLGTLSFASRAKESFSDSELVFMATISRYVALAKERLRSENALREAGMAKDQFLAVLSHELRTPLTPVLAAVSLLERKQDLNDEFCRCLDIIRRNVGLEARLIDDLLDLTRIVRGKVELARKPTDLCGVIERAVNVCKPDIDARKLHFGLELKCGESVVNGDPSRLEQVLWNLIKNSVKFTPDGGCVGISAFRRDGKVVVEVKDSGIGIEPAALHRIFNAFEQANSGITRQFGGLGLGLAIAKRVVEMHDGTIQAYSEGKGRGAKFTIELPLVAEKEKRAEEIVAPQSLPKRILLVEDHGDTAQMMQSILESSGHEVETAGDVSQALAATSSRKFDLLVSDLGLPDRSGLELMKELRKEGNSIRGIALSGYGREDDVRQSKEAGFTEHITKPVEVDLLLEAIDRVAQAL